MSVLMLWTQGHECNNQICQFFVQTILYKPMCTKLLDHFSFNKSNSSESLELVYPSHMDHAVIIFTLIIHSVASCHMRNDQGIEWVIHLDL